jgi:hypothetical protein
VRSRHAWYLAFSIQLMRCESHTDCSIDMSQQVSLQLLTKLKQLMIMLTTADKFTYIWHKCWNYNTQAQSQTFIFICKPICSTTLKWIFIYSSVDTKTVTFPKSLIMMYLYSNNSSSNLLTSEKFSSELPTHAAVVGRPRGHCSSPGTVMNFHFFTSFRPALGSIQPAIQLVPRALSPEVKRQRSEANHSPPISAEVTKKWIYTSTLPRVFMA